jgi:hypothetical protein
LPTCTLVNRSKIYSLGVVNSIKSNGGILNVRVAIEVILSVSNKAERY